MGSQTPLNNDRSRTYWTPTMERYFLDLMLEHMNRGNRVGHTFNKQAWTEMLSVFNAKFRSQYDKDVLKSRYTNLWKQFNDIKYLLGQSGFSWDDTRQMVTAADYIWDAYIKVHPDARSYRTKPVLNFNDLCLIYGYTTADGRYSRSSHDVDIDDEVQGVNIGAETGNLISSSNERSRTEWTADMDRYFIELMLDQLGKGNKIDNTFTKQAWTDMLFLFNAKFGPQHGKRVLRHRYKKLWKYYRDMTKLLKQKAFVWDESRHIIAADDHVWDAYIKAHSYARFYRTKLLPNYKDLILIYGNATEDGEHNNSHESKDFEDSIGAAKAGEGAEGQSPTSSERSRTYWMPPMDRYLVDLLVEQVNKGNKLGQTFISQAWVDMAALFSVKFNSHHDKDVLKNRYKHLRRVYNAIKTLLEQDGFSWDDTREMLRAEDHVWDNYTKVHPDARTYRVKTVPSYHKLAAIYGKESYNQRYSHLAQNTAPGGEISRLEGGQENAYQLLSDDDTLRVDWLPAMDRLLIDLLLEHIREGNKVGQMFSEQAWDRIVASFSEKCGVRYDKCILEKEYMRLINEYDDISYILNQTGFAWDETQQVITADANVWEACIKENPDSIVYRDKVLENYNDVSLIVGAKILDGLLNCRAPEKETNHKACGSMEANLVSASPEPSVRDNRFSKQGKKRQCGTTSTLASCGKVHKTGKLKMQEALTQMTGVVTSLVTIKKEEKNYIPIENAIDALQAVPDIDDELLLDGCDLLEDETKAKTFLALDATLRKKWLLRKLRPQVS